MSGVKPAVGLDGSLGQGSGDVVVHTEDSDFTLLNCDVLEGLRSLEDESVHCVVTSPPYWGLRDYGTGSWVGGDPEHVHETVGARGGRGGSGAPGKQTEGAFPSTLAVDDCSCGARRVDSQLGLEPTPDAYITRMVEVFQEVKRVLRRDGTLWLNIGDSYVGGDTLGRNDAGRNFTGGGGNIEGSGNPGRQGKHERTSGLKPKDLVGIPWKLAFALQADGWYLRADIIWSKPNPMPESVTDRPTKAHEYVFLLTRSPRYFFDQEAVREPAEYGRREWSNVNGNLAGVGIQGERGHATVRGSDPSAGRNVRSVWEIATQPYKDAHFATYPEELVRRCILAGTSERGCCPVCGTPWERETETSYEKSPVHGAGSVVGRHYETGANNFDGAGMPRLNKKVETLGWRPGCECAAKVFREPTIPRFAPIPCTVLDPFLGSGTTAYVARKHGRRSIGIELNADYCELAAKRMQQQSLFA